MEDMPSEFSLLDYDCIGFDLDYTLVQYNVLNMSRLIYNILAQYLVEHFGYKSLEECSFEEGIPFLQKGLIMDFKKGNIVKLSVAGKVMKASHGTKPMNCEQIENIYGQDRIWTDAIDYVFDILGSWNNEKVADTLRSVLCYYDIACILLYGRIIDSIDNGSQLQKEYRDVWPNILAGLNYMYDVKSFSQGEGKFFPALTSDPSRIIKKNSENLMKWLKSLRKDHGKFIFLITGSAADQASFTSNFSNEEGWDDLYDLVVCFARKPGFFRGDRPFLSVENLQEGNECKLSKDIRVVSQGNWSELQKVLVEYTGKTDPKCVYVGDNVVQDVIAPHASGCCDTVAICEELVSDFNALTSHSPVWGSFFQEMEGDLPLWHALINKHAVLCIPSVEVLANSRMDAVFKKKFVCNPIQ